ncbi:MAG: hypothetical protein HC888_00185 [Candidatus Competibacteraceae bacterium]|nr:hypothetical protein [Candidatus Competibacteraceae bacterium]
MAGVLTVRQYFPNTEAADIAKEIYDRVDWNWMLNGENTFSMGWTPEHGFIAHRWDHYSEHLLLQILALGSNTHPVPKSVWQAWERGPTMVFEGEEYMTYPPLFVHQFSHAWLDFRDKNGDKDYWRNSVVATRAHRQMFIDLSSKFPHYGENLWGLTSSDSQRGYIDWGGPPSHPSIDGTIVPCAAAGSIPFAPKETIAVLETIQEKYGSLAASKYGFIDAFNPHNNWRSNYVIGIDVGITVLMIENHRDGFVWEYFMRNKEVQRGMKKAGFELRD